jgi:hypothetical protein
MPKCRHEIRGWTGLDELMRLRAHFLRKHKIDLSMDAALKVREVIEAGEVPIRVGEEEP